MTTETNIERCEGEIKIHERERDRQTERDRERGERSKETCGKLMAFTSLKVSERDIS